MFGGVTCGLAGDGRIVTLEIFGEDVRIQN
jgi:hypothetical protein